MSQKAFEADSVPLYGLNDEQGRAVTAPSPTTLVRASAGSGKTRCLVAKIRLLLDSGVSASSVCSITFTNKAAEEMKERLRRTNDITGMQVSTIHSMCVRIMKAFPGHTPLRVPFSIYDDADQLSVIKTVMKARGFPENPSDILEIISRAKSEDETEMLEGVAKTVYKSYQEILLKNNAADFDDLQLYAFGCLKHDDCRGHFNAIWQHVLVDECQDTSQIQYAIIRFLYNINITKTLFLVADSNQSIYGWRGARPENMDNFIKEYQPSIQNLTYNYRCSEQIVAHANGFLQFGEHMVSKSQASGKVSLTAFQSREDEAERAVQVIIAMGNYEETAVLYRVNARSLGFEQALSRHRVPYKVCGDTPFYRRKIIKDLISGLKAAVNPSDIEALARIINTPRRGFGAAKREQLFLQGRQYVEGLAGDMPAIADFLKILDDIKSMRPLDALNEYIFRTNYPSTITKDSGMWLIDALREAVTQYDTVDELIMASTFLEEDEGKGVKLMTAHSSKGLEFDRVFVVGVESGLWPHQYAEDLAEEERLFYVACTRAKRYLNVSYCKSRTFRGQPMESMPSQLFKKLYKSVFSKDMT